MAFKIFTDSGANLSTEQIEKFGVSVFNLGYIINGEEFLAQGETEEFIKFTYNKMREKVVVMTNAVRKVDMEEVFEKELKEGNDILYIAFTSTLSSTCDIAKVTAKEVMQKCGGKGRISVIDSCAAAMGQGMLVIEACKLKAAGKSMEEIEKWLDENKMKAVHLFTVENLSYLHRGGRIKKSTAVIGSMLNIKPLMRLDLENALAPYGKALGRNLALKSLASMVQKSIVDPKGQTIYISHADCLEDAKHLQKAICEKVEGVNCEIGNLALVIGAHSGPGTIAIFFFGNRKI